MPTIVRVEDDFLTGDPATKIWVPHFADYPLAFGPRWWGTPVDLRPVASLPNIGVSHGLQIAGMGPAINQGALWAIGDYYVATLLSLPRPVTYAAVLMHVSSWSLDPDQTDYPADADTRLSAPGTTYQYDSRFFYSQLGAALNPVPPSNTHGLVSDLEYGIGGHSSALHPPPPLPPSSFWFGYFYSENNGTYGGVWSGTEPAFDVLPDVVMTRRGNPLWFFDPSHPPFTTGSLFYMQGTVRWQDAAYELVGGAGPFVPPPLSPIGQSLTIDKFVLKGYNPGEEIGNVQATTGPGGVVRHWRHTVGMHSPPGQLDGSPSLLSPSYDGDVQGKRTLGGVVRNHRN